MGAMGKKDLASRLKSMGAMEEKNLASRLRVWEPWEKSYGSKGLKVVAIHQPQLQMHFPGGCILGRNYFKFG